MKKFLMIVVGIVILLVIVAAALPFVIDVDRFRPTIETKFSDAIGRKVSIGHLSLSILSGDLKADDISIADDPAFSSTPFVQAKALAVGIEVMPLIFDHAVKVRSIGFQGPQVSLLRSESGKWNFSSLKQSDAKSEAPPAGAPGNTTQVTVGKLQITDGSLTIGSGPHSRQTYDKMNLTAENIAYDDAFPFHFSAGTPGGGTIELEGAAGPINQQDAAQSPLEAKITLKQVNLASTGFLDPSAGIGGIADYQGTVKSAKGMQHSEGTATVSKLLLVQSGSPATQPVTVSYAADYDLAKQAGQLTKGQIVTGKSTVALSGTYETHGESQVIHMKVNAPKVPVQDIQALLPALGVKLPEGSSLQSGDVKTALTLDGPVDKLVTAGDVSLSNAKLAGFGLSSKMSGIAALAGLKPSSDTLIQTFASNVHIAPDGTRADAIQLIAPDIGTITGSGTIAPGGALNFKLLATLSSNSVGGMITGLAARVGVGGAIGKGIPFLVQGTTSKPTFAPDTGAMFKNAASGQSGATGSKPPAATVGNILQGIFGKKK